MIVINLQLGILFSFIVERMPSFFIAHISVTTPKRIANPHQPSDEAHSKFAQPFSLRQLCNNECDHGE